MLSPQISVDDHDGLQLDTPPALVGPAAALDLLDVDWDTRGVLGSRMGVKAFVDDAAGNYDVIFGAGVLFDPLGETFALLARRGETLVILNEDGSEGDTLEVTEGGLDFAQIGLNVLTPVTYIANQEKQIRKFYQGEFSDPTATVDGAGGKAMPEGYFVEPWADAANRLVVAGTGLSGGPAGAPGSPSHVFFSEPGQPEHFEADAFVELNPGDGDRIVGCVSWGNQIFVFKDTHLFLFYGVSADIEGKPIFNFKTIDLGTRALAPRGRGAPHVVAGRDGVYFIARDGIWVTTGGPPILVTPSLNFNENRRDQRSELGGAPFPTWPQAKGLCYANGSLFVNIAEEAGEGLIPVKRMLKIDLATRKASYWKTNLNAFTLWASTWAGVPRLFFSGAGEDNKGIYYFTPEVDVDPVVDMDPYWLSGFYDVADNPDEKTVTWTKVWGSGEVEVGVGEDYKSIEREKPFPLGAGAAIAQHQENQDQSATFLSHRISGVAPWSVQRLTRFVRETRVPATQKSSS